MCKFTHSNFLMNGSKIILLLLVVALNVSCKKLPTYPEVPTLEYKSLYFEQNVQGQDERFVLTATFTDGDGDVGYHSELINGAQFDSASSPYYYNFVITLSILRNNVWNDTTFNVSARLPYLTPEGKHKALKATIDKTDFLPYIGEATIRFHAFIYDRALHKSNEITTPAFIVHTP
jgi:hypothetical protein